MHANRTSLLVLVSIGALTLVSAAASASHWCGQTTFTISPADPVATRSTTFSVAIANSGVDNTQLEDVEVKFSWEGTWHNAGSGTVLAGQSKSFSTSATPPSAGTYTVEVKATGTSSGDWLHEVIDCTASTTVQAREPPAGALPGFEGVTVVLAIFGVAIVGLKSSRR